MIAINGLTFWEKIRYITISPERFFDLIEREIDIKKSIIYYFLIQLMVLPLGIIVSVLLNPGNTILSIFTYILAIIVGMGIYFLILLLYHLIMPWFGGHQGMIRTFQALIYGSTPAFLLSWIPFINILAAFYSIYLSILGLIRLQQMETWKAIVAYFIPGILAFTLALIATIFILVLV